MKKLILILFTLFFALLINAQSPKVFNQNIEVRKAAPTLFLNGTGAKIDFYNGDVTITQSSNLLTIAGANYLKIGTDTLATRADARSMSGGGGATDTTHLSARIDLKLAAADTNHLSDRINLKANTNHTQAQSTITALSDSLLARYTKIQANSLLSGKANTSHSQAQSTITALTDSLLARYTKAQVNAIILLITAFQDSVRTVLGDTINIETLLQLDFDTDTVATKADARAGGGVAIEDVRLLADTIPLFVFGAGGGNAGDTTLFTTSTIYGAFYNKGSDTLRVTELRCVMGHGLGLDTLDVQVWWNDTLNVETGASVAKLNTVALPIGRPSGTTTGTLDTSFAISKIPPGVWVWCKTPYVPAAALKRKPVYLNVQLSGYKIPKY